jgi:hypothetical protein
MRTLLLLFAVLALSSCARTYVHPTKTDADYSRDWNDCTEDATLRVYTSGLGNNPMAIDNFRYRCLESKHGWVEQKARQ